MIIKRGLFAHHPPTSLHNPYPTTTTGRCLERSTPAAARHTPRTLPRRLIRTGKGWSTRKGKMEWERWGRMERDRWGVLFQSRTILESIEMKQRRKNSLLLLLFCFLSSAVTVAQTRNVMNDASTDSFLQPRCSRVLINQPISGRDRRCHHRSPSSWVRPVF